MKALKFAILLLIAVALLAQEPLTNDSVVKMVKAGLGEGVIVSMIQSQPGKYSLAADDLVKLKTQGVSDKVLGAMIVKNSGSAAPAGPAHPDSDLPQNMDIGIYYKMAGVWHEMLPEVVTWKTGGVLKGLASGGIIKGDVNGHLEGPASKNDAVTPVEVLIYAPEGVAITEYQLLHLHAEKNSREFRTITGGVFHSSGGATRDIVPFDGQKIASRTYRITLPHLTSGDYGFLPPGAIGSASSASIGKLYTFHVVE